MRLGLIPRLRKAASVTALFAILLQLAIAATHHHAVVLGGANQIGAQLSLTAPPDGGSAPASDELCEICLGLALGSSFVVPDAPSLDLAPAGPPVQLSAPESRARTVLLAFHSRAPPAL
jgi:hypothetical protein